MSKRLLITRPEYDTATFYLSKWSERVLEFARERDIEILDLVRENANRNKVEGMIRSKEPKLIIFNGHGDRDLIKGNNGEVLVNAGKNEMLLKSKITYAISCKSALELGERSVKEGALAYLGYNDDFIFVFDKNKTATPLKDEFAKMFMEPSNELILSLIKGNTVGESYKRSQLKFKENIQKLLTSEAPLGSENQIRYLFWDMKHQVMLGDIRAYF
jgi:hypothetical protein